jgi:hypothetical protein
MSKGANVDDWYLKESDCDRLLKIAHSDHRLSDEEVSTIIDFCQFFAGKLRRYVMKHKDGYQWTKDRVLRQCDNKMIILDGSAIYSSVKWDGFQILQAKEHQAIRYEGGVIHARKGNPTKSRLLSDIDDWIDSIMNDIEPASKQVFIASNKVPEKKVQDAIDKLSEYVGKGYVKTLYRGSIVGRNDAKDCETAIIAMSLFTTLQDYVLRTALVEGKGIDESRIFGNNNQVMMHQGFDDSMIDREFRRKYIDELYQTLMRTRARNYQGETWEAYCHIPDMYTLIELERKMKGIVFADCNDADVKAFNFLKDMSIDELHDISDKELREVTFNKDRSPESFIYRQRLLAMMISRKNAESNEPL